MDFLKAGEPVESNIFNQLDEKKRALIEKGVDVINLSIGTPDFQPDKHVMEAVSRAALDPDMYKYSLTETPELLDAVCRGRGFLMKGGVLDTERACKVVLDEFRGGKLGRISLEAPAALKPSQEAQDDPEA